MGDPIRKTLTCTLLDLLGHADVRIDCFTSLRAGSPVSHTRERRRAKRSGGKESGEEVPLDFALAATTRAHVLQFSHALQREPARRLLFYQPFVLIVVILSITVICLD